MANPKGKAAAERILNSARAGSFFHIELDPYSALIRSYGSNLNVSRMLVLWRARRLSRSVIQGSTSRRVCIATLSELERSIIARESTVLYDDGRLEMAGKKGRSGGKRAGAGAKQKGNFAHLHELIDLRVADGDWAAIIGALVKKARQGSVPAFRELRQPFSHG